MKMQLTIKLDKVLVLLNLKAFVNEPVIFISEKNDWAIKYVGQNIMDSVNESNSGFMKITTLPKYYQNKVIHFGSQYMWVDWWKILPKNNNYVVSFFHGKKEDGKEVEKHINKFLESVAALKKIVVSSTIVKERLLLWGVPPNKVCLIPIGVNNNHFKPTTALKKKSVRKDYGITMASIVIGSFQKDGVGWQNGDTPKMIKGPDIFIKVLKILKQKGYEVTVLLTGPARGYIKKELKKINVKYKHKYFKNHNDLLNCYHALDFYLITSREEGGPMGLMEAMASGIPVISTPVGMAADLIKNNLSGKISCNFDHNKIAKLIISLIEDKKLKQRIIKNALLAVDDVKWTKVSDKHYKYVYLPLVNKY